MNNQPQLKKLSDIMSGASRIGIIGSPSSTAEVCLEIMGHSVNRKLVGELVLFNYLQDGAPQYALGQINEVRMNNVWHESPTIRSLARRRGEVDHISAVQDTHQGKMLVSAVFSETERDTGVMYDPSFLGTVPATGTAVCLADDDILSTLLHPYRNQLFYLGNVYGSKPKMPLWFKHFDSGPDGAGEAYHLGVFGKTGAGKSVLAKMLMLAYARHRDMAILVLDPQGEFSKDVRNAGMSDQFPVEYQKTNGGILVRRVRKEIIRMTIRNIVLDTWGLFSEILEESPFFERLTIPKGENRNLACGVLADELKKAKITLANLHKRESFDKAWEILEKEKNQMVFYRSEAPRKRFAGVLTAANPDEYYQEYWKPVAELFNAGRENAQKLSSALRRLLELGGDGKSILLVDLSKEQAKGLFWNDKIQSMVVKRTLDGLVVAAEDGYQNNRSLNTLVIIDEAHRLAPRELAREDDIGRGVRASLIDAVRTTRKYGLGWLFISQTLSSLHMEILQQLRIMFFGFGLGLGSEFQSLKQLVGSAGAALDLYQTFRDPHSALDASRRQYSFMTVGPVSPLSFSGSPLFFNAFNSRGEFNAANFPQNDKATNDNAGK